MNGESHPAGDRPPARSLRERGHVGFPPGSRFLMLPVHPPRAARAGLALYEAVEPRQRLAARAGRILTDLGLARLLPATDRKEVDWDWWTAYAREVIEPATRPVSAFAFRVPENPRVSALAFDQAGRPLAFAKLLNTPAPEAPERAGSLLSDRPTEHFRVPFRIAEGRFRDRCHRLLEPLPEGLHDPPPHDPQRLWAIVDEFQGRLTGLPRPEGTPDEHVPCHADLTPRNLRIATDGQWWLFDWDNVRWGPRLADELRYWCAAFVYAGRIRIQRAAADVLGLLRRRGGEEEIRAALAWPDRVQQTYRPLETRLHAAVTRLAGEETASRQPISGEPVP